MGIPEDPTGLPSLGAYILHHKRTPIFSRQLEWRVKIGGGGAPPGGLSGVPRIRDQIDSCLPGANCELGHWVESREPWPWAGEGRRAGEGVRQRRAHPSRLSTWQLQFARPSLILSLTGACHGASGSPARAPSWGQGARGPLSKSSDTQ